MNGILGVESRVAAATQVFVFTRIPGLNADPALKGRAKVIPAALRPALWQPHGF